MKMTHDDEIRIIAACKILASEHIGDFVYSIRDRCLEDVPENVSTWEAPRVKAFGNACMVVQDIAKKYGLTS